MGDVQNSGSNGNWRWLLERWGHLEEKLNQLMQYPPQIRDRLEEINTTLHDVKRALEDGPVNEEGRVRKGLYIPWWLVLILILGSLIGAWQLSVDWDTVDRVTEQAQKVRP